MRASKCPSWRTTLCDPLERLGWSPRAPFEPALSRLLDRLSEPDLSIHRVTAAHRGQCELLGAAGPTRGIPRRRVAEGRPLADQAPGPPTVGDWVLAYRRDPEPAIIEAILPRATWFGRKAAGRTSREQVIAANVDVVAVVVSANADFSPRRVERYLVAIAEGGARPLVVLSKVDLASAIDGLTRRLQAVAPGTPVVAVSAHDGVGMEALAEHMIPGATWAFVGSSGAGKSTLVNALLGEERLVTQPIRASDETGCHTTTHRELVALPGGALLIDTPGLRELAVLASEAAVEAAYVDIAELSDGCRFRDCAHGNEPGCGVRAAVEAGELDPGRVASEAALRREAARELAKHDAGARADLRRQQRARGRMYREVTKRSKKR